MPVVEPGVASACAGPATLASASTTIPRRARSTGAVSPGSSGTGDRRRRRIGAGTALLALDVLLDRLDVVAGASDDGEQVVHRGDLLDLLLDEPLHELLGGEVALLPGGPGEREDLLRDALLLREGELHRRD